jgi:hypothetical protein
MYMRLPAECSTMATQAYLRRSTLLCPALRQCAPARRSARCCTSFGSAGPAKRRFSHVCTCTRKLSASWGLYLKRTFHLLLPRSTLSERWGESLRVMCDKHLLLPSAAHTCFVPSSSIRTAAAPGWGNSASAGRPLVPEADEALLEVVIAASKNAFESLFAFNFRASRCRVGTLQRS